MFNNNNKQSGVTERSVYYVATQKTEGEVVDDYSNWWTINNYDKDLALGLLNIHYNDIDIYELCGIIIYNERLSK
jgi:hypothetical protein